MTWDSRKSITIPLVQNHLLPSPIAHCLCVRPSCDVFTYYYLPNIKGIWYPSMGALQTDTRENLEYLSA